MRMLWLRIKHERWRLWWLWCRIFGHKWKPVWCENEWGRECAGAHCVRCYEDYVPEDSD